MTDAPEMIARISPIIGFLVFSAFAIIFTYANTRFVIKPIMISPVTPIPTIGA